MLCDDVLWCAEYEGEREKQARTHRMSLRLEGSAGCEEEKHEEESLEADESSNARGFFAYLILGACSAALSTISLVSLIFFFNISTASASTSTYSHTEQATAVPFYLYPLVVAAAEPALLISLYALPLVRAMLAMRSAAILLLFLALVSWAIYLFAVSGLLSRDRGTVIFLLFMHRVLLGLSEGLQILFLEFLSDLPTRTLATGNDLTLAFSRTWLGPGIGLLLALSPSSRDKRIIFNRLTGVAWFSMAACILLLVFVFKHPSFSTRPRPRIQILATTSAGFGFVVYALYFCCCFLYTLVVWGVAWNLVEVEILYQQQESSTKRDVVQAAHSVFLLFLPIALGGCFGTYCSFRLVLARLSRYRFVFVRKAEELSTIFGLLLLLMSLLTLLTSFLFLKHDSFKYYSVMTSSSCLLGLALAYFTSSINRLHVIYSSGEHDFIAAYVHRRAVSDATARFLGVLATGLLLAFNLLTVWLYYVIALVVVSLILALVAANKTWKAEEQYPHLNNNNNNNNTKRERSTTAFLASEHFEVDVVD